MIKYLLPLVATLAAAPALAAGPLTVESSMLSLQKRAAADGTTQVSLAPAGKVVPGDKVVIRLSYRNTGSAPIADVVLSNPLPQGISYRAPAAGSPAPELSVDGKTFGALDALRVATPEGGQRAATASDVTHVRWRIARPIAAGASGQVSIDGILR
jgi:uncharacterized repeat protein (TIGR01451 family)